MRRLVVLGGRGFFGGLAVEQLRAAGLAPLVASRRLGAGVDLAIDVESNTSIRAALRPRDLAIDAAGPFQERTAALAECAVEIGFDLIDISDSLRYAERILALEPRIEKAGIRVLTAASSISAVTAAAVVRSGFAAPLRVTGFLAPAVRHSGRAGVTRSLLASAGLPIRVLRGGRLVETRGWSERRSFDLPAPLGRVIRRRVAGRLFESADSLLLPRIWPSLKDASFFVHTNVPGLDGILGAAARCPPLRRLIERAAPVALPLVRRLGKSSGLFAVEVEGLDGETYRASFSSARHGQWMAVVPAILAARAILEGRFEPRGLVPPDRHVEPAELIRSLKALGIELIEERLAPPGPPSPPPSA